MQIIEKGSCASPLLPAFSLGMLDRISLELPESTQGVNLKQYTIDTLESDFDLNNGPVICSDISADKFLLSQSTMAYKKS